MCWTWEKNCKGKNVPDSFKSLGGTYYNCSLFVVMVLTLIQMVALFIKHVIKTFSYLAIAWIYCLRMCSA